MAKRKSVKVMDKTSTGKNIEFLDQNNGQKMTRQQFVKKIEGGNYPNYHIRKINKVKIPVSNPDKNKRNNLG